MSGTVAGTGTSTVQGRGAASSPCLQKITFQEVQQIWPAKDTLQGWYLDGKESNPAQEKYLDFF
ncbi:MAG: hypothetical protein QXO51_04925 [Halobacteria archaeon]